MEEIPKFESIEEAEKYSEQKIFEIFNDPKLLD